MRGKRLTVYVDDSDLHHHHPLYMEILQRLKRAGIAGATVTRGVAGFGARAFVKTADIEVLSGDLPIIITVIDAPERIERVVPEIAAILTGGVMTTEDTEIRYYAAAFKGGLPDVTVGQVMSAQPESIGPDAPIAEVVARLVERAYTALPVVDGERRLLGMIDEGALLERGLGGMELDLHRLAGADPLRALVEKLKSDGLTVRQLMAEAPTVTPQTPLRDAAHLMHVKRVKRLAVVDDDKRLVGMLGRLDVLRSVATGHERRAGTHVAPLPQEHRRVADVMDREVVTVVVTTPLLDVLDQVLESAERRVIVVDAEHRPIGIVTDTDLVTRVAPEDRPGLLTAIRSRWNEEARKTVARAKAQRVGDLMTSPVVMINEDRSVMEALAVTVARHIKRIPVVDADGKLVGIVARQALLAACLDLAS